MGFLFRTCPRPSSCYDPYISVSLVEHSQAISTLRTMHPSAWAPSIPVSMWNGPDNANAFVNSSGCCNCGGRDLHMPNCPFHSGCSHCGGRDLHMPSCPFHPGCSHCGFRDGHMPNCPFR
ncbi:hypothetical protein SCLCIDRAFT_580472 [Scleroderma citrinum Foug A]|uniref:Uncharacterized protein n=1 Tax=Scleroderma citrinum Foug A TaxID=1036808 RepID=A0A0C3CUD1_9AGAM|nr:hypothetical protein SCLCIDRAFT_580472 [Scleroderma citrinum Foug A]